MLALSVFSCMVVFVQSLIHVQLFVTPWTTACQASLSFTISQSLLRLTPIKSVMPSNHLILCHPLFLLPSIFPSIRVFSNESVLHIRWPKYWSFSFSISPSNEYSGLIPFRIDCFDLLAFQGTLKSLLQHYSSKASSLLCSASLCRDSCIWSQGSSLTFCPCWPLTPDPAVASASAHHPPTLFLLPSSGFPTCALTTLHTPSCRRQRRLFTDKAGSLFFFSKCLFLYIFGCAGSSLLRAAFL